MKNRDFYPLVAVVGPTASGKTALAMELARRLDGEVINTDSMQVYRYFDIGTAKPTPAERRAVPHHLVDVVDPDQAYSAGRYVDDARAAMAEIRARGRLPILCGGTGLYFRALLFGIADMPPIPPAVREEVAARVESEGLAACHADLARVDPHTARRVHPNDTARISRGLEVFMASGTPLSHFQHTQPFHASAPGVLSVGYAHDRAALYARINARVEAMMAQGWVAEVQRLLSRGYPTTLKPMRALGYRQIALCLRRGEDPRAVAPHIAQQTRRYAKRQLTWFRKHPDIVWAPPGESALIVEAVKKFLIPGDGGR